MPLCIKLAPNDGLYVGTTLLRNGKRSSDIAVMSPDARVLHEKFMLANPDIAMAYLRGDPTVTYDDVRGREPKP